MEHCAHELEILTLSVTGECQLAVEYHFCRRDVSPALSIARRRAGEEGRWPLWAELFPRASICSKLA